MSPAPRCKSFLAHAHRDQHIRLFYTQSELSICSAPRDRLDRTNKRGLEQSGLAIDIGAGQWVHKLYQLQLQRRAAHDQGKNPAAAAGAALSRPNSEPSKARAELELAIVEAGLQLQDKYCGVLDAKQSQRRRAHRYLQNVPPF